MKNKDLHIRLSQKRLEKPKAYAISRDKSVTSLIEDWIDTLPELEDVANTRG